VSSAIPKWKQQFPDLAVEWIVDDKELATFQLLGVAIPALLANALFDAAITRGIDPYRFDLLWLSSHYNNFGSAIRLGRMQFKPKNGAFCFRRKDFGNIETGLGIPGQLSITIDGKYGFISAPIIRIVSTEDSTDGFVLGAARPIRYPRPGVYVGQQFNIQGTVTGRMSSAQPNISNTPKPQRIIMHPQDLEDLKAWGKKS
jgi:hypothetical protein